MPDKIYLRQMQALPLIVKVRKTQLRIKEWYDHFDGNVYVSFSGGKDSTVLAHLVHELYPEVPLVFANTGLEYPEIQSFARKMGAEFVRPKMMFSEVISKYGYPIISKEVSEAIYYARRIRNGGGYLETERRRSDLQTEQNPGAHTAHKRLDLTGNRTFERFGKTGVQKRNEINGLRGGGYDERRGKLAGVGEFSKDEKSLFNKEKWLPMCQEAQFMISNKCCSAMKKSPIQSYQRRTHRVPFIGTLTEESKLREQAWVKHGCNAFDSKKPTSQPLSFWTEQDILKYLYVEGYEIASVYGDIVGVDAMGFEYEPLPGVDCKLKCTGCQRTGCIFCGFGCHLEKGETRFQRLAKTHPKQYEYCMGGGQWSDNPAYDPTAPKMDGDWQNWNPKKIWTPSKEGLGMKHVFDECNQIYGKDFIRYE